MQIVQNPWGLTRAEADVMNALCDHGETMQVVADRLGIAFWTVNDHLKSAYEKLGARRMVLACLKWDRWRLSRTAGAVVQISGAVSDADQAKLRQSLADAIDRPQPLVPGPAPSLVGAGRFARRPDGSWFEVSKVCANAPGVVTLYHGPGLAR